MFFTNLKRILQSGFMGFWRNAFVSLSSMLIMIVTILVVGVLMFVSVLLTDTLHNFEERVDINVYLAQDASEQEIRALQTELENLEQVKSVKYTSREDALIEFKKNNPEFNKAFDVLEDNPLSASLNILAKNTSEYEQVQAFLDSKTALTASGETIIQKSNYNNNKAAIDRLTSIIETTKRAGLYSTIVLFLLSILITFNTVRLAIYTSREEISVMRLVGASDSFIRGPFVVSGVIGGVFAGALVLMMFYPLTLWLAPKARALLESTNIFDYYIDNFLQLALVFVGLGILLGAISSFLAVRRYLRN